MQHLRAVAKLYATVMLCFGVFAAIGAAMSGAADAIPYFVGTMGSAMCLGVIVAD